MDIDTSKPNAGRIYDYLLGGHHNFEADRNAAEFLRQQVPQLPKWMRLNRWFLGHAVDGLVAGGFNHYIDLATGLPTQGYLHERVPATTRIIYNDIDPTTVAYAEQMLVGRTNIRYVQSDIRSPEQVLRQADAFFGGERHVGICMVGVAYFIDDAALKHTLRQLYDWAAPGSRLAVSFITVNGAFPVDAPVMEIYQKMGSAIYPRTQAEIADVMQLWRPIAPGLRALASYIEEETGIAVQIPQLPSGEAMMGGIFEKPAA